MKEFKTINLKINISDEKEYLKLIEDCNNMFNDYCAWCFENKTHNRNKAHKGLYFISKEKYPLVKTALQQALRDNAMEACKRSKLKDKVPIKKTLSIRLNNWCFTLRGEQLTLIGVSERHKEILHIPVHYKEIYENWKPKSGTLSYCKKTKQFWIHIAFENPKEPKLNISNQHDKIVGLDRGIYNILASSDGQLFGRKKVRFIKNDYAFQRQQLQKKGTRSAKRKLKLISGKEKRFVLDTNHCLSKKIVNDNRYDTFVLENLKGIKNKKKGRKLNRKINGWSYFQLQTLLTYKAQALGKQIVYVHPAYTSLTCSCCGKIAKEQRDKNKYICSCGYKNHADLNAAINIKNKYISHYLSKDNGVVDNQPNVSLDIIADTSLQTIVNQSNFQ